MKIFKEIFEKNRKAAIKNRPKRITFIPKIQNKNGYQERNFYEEKSDFSFETYTHDTPRYEIVDAQTISDIFERDSRRYVGSFED